MSGIYTFRVTDVDQQVRLLLMGEEEGYIT